MNNRKSGILLHISSLPARFGIGDMGPEAHKFVSQLKASGQTLWQILPLNPTRSIYAHSPYSSASAFAGNPLLISPELMLSDGYIDRTTLQQDCPDFPDDNVDFDKVEEFKEKLFDSAFERFSASGKNEKYKAFCVSEQAWLAPHAEFTAISRELGFPALSKWPKDLRTRDAAALSDARNRLAHEIEKEKFIQFLFFSQWDELKTTCNANGIELIGDLPIYVNADSVDVWANPESFLLNPDLKPSSVAGVPPDYFSATGQRWGNPLYNWELMKEQGFSWWIARLKHASRLYDQVRIDHFRGFSAFWKIPASEKSAVKGQWIDAPGHELFQKVKEKLPELKIIAEDLGVITDEVTKLRTDFNLPGMKVLMFAFNLKADGKANEYLPHLAEANSVIYTGTHDNNTALGWFQGDATKEEKEQLFKYTGKKLKADEVSGTLIDLAMSAKSMSALFPIQDILGLGEEARMNLPSTSRGNWTWRLKPGQFSEEKQEELCAVAVKHKRAAR